MLTSIQPGTLLAETFSVIDVVPTPSVQHPRFRAMDLTTTSEVFVTAVPLLAGNLATLAAISDRLKKLSHPDIQAHLGFWTDAHAAYLVDAPLMKMASDPIAKPPTAAQLRRLVAALDYAEALGFHQTGFDLAWLTQTDHQGFLVQHLGQIPPASLSTTSGQRSGAAKSSTPIPKTSVESSGQAARIMRSAQRPTKVNQRAKIILRENSLAIKAPHDMAS